MTLNTYIYFTWKLTVNSSAEGIRELMVACVRVLQTAFAGGGGAVALIVVLVVVLLLIFGVFLVCLIMKRR